MLAQLGTNDLHQTGYLQRELEAPLPEGKADRYPVSGRSRNRSARGELPETPGIFIVLSGSPRERPDFRFGSVQGAGPMGAANNAAFYSSMAAAHVLSACLLILWITVLFGELIPLAAASGLTERSESSEREAEACAVFHVLHHGVVHSQYNLLLMPHS